MKQQLTTATDVRQLGTILFVGAHPDDETFCAGALLAAAVRNGQRVVCVTATRGEKGVQDESKWPPGQLGEIRTHELEAALKLLGIIEHYWLGYHDGDCASVSREEAARFITGIIERCLVDTVLTFGSDGLTGHPDHRTVSRWVDSAVHASSRRPRVYHVAQLRSCYQGYLREADKKLHIFFKTKHPRLFEADECAICLLPEPRAIEQKYRALRAMPSQTTTLLEVIAPGDFVGALGTEAFVDPRAGRRR